MKTKLSMILLGGVIIGLTGCGNSAKGVNASQDLNKIYSDCLSQNESYTCAMNWTLQSYLETYSSYRLLNTSNKEFTVKPKEPNSLFTYGASRDSMCAYDYALFYNKDNNSYYSVELSCDSNEDDPTFGEATLLK